jgi:hypothetical protein
MDAKGVIGEGVMLGIGDVHFGFIEETISRNLIFIFESWQGHQNFGSGFQKKVEFFSNITVSKI